MRRSYLIATIAAGGLTLASLAVVSLTGQTPAAASKTKTAAASKTGSAVSRTAWGDPNLQGTWFVLYDVPLERSAANANKEFLTDAEVEAANAAKGINPGRNTRSTGAQDVSGAYNAVFNSVLRTGKRTSMIIDPPDGKIPALTAEARARVGPNGGRGGPLGLGVGGTQNDNPETVPQNPRCLGVPMPFLPLNTLFAQGTVMQLVQSPKSIGIYMEDDHAGGGNRIIYMDGRPHAPAAMKFYLGDSRGHWEGNTLVVETTNFSQAFRGSDIETYKMIEHITRMDATHLRREITFDDPHTWTRPWTVQIDMGKEADDSKHMIFDSACHEGNYGMTGLLVGTRREEAAAAGKKK